jgi:hypothetical protein
VASLAGIAAPVVTGALIQNVPGALASSSALRSAAR